jgi:toxin YoeB
VVTWNLVYSKFALKDAKKLSAAGLRDKAQTLLDLVEVDPFKNPPPYEKLVGDLKGAYSRRINIQHHLVYEVFRKEKTVRILRMWTHYD